MRTADAPTTIAEMLATVPEPADARIQSGPVDYTLDGTELRGFFAFDAASSERRPGVVLFHDWTGLDEREEARATMLARLGFVVFALDIYGRDVRPNGPEASAVSGEYYGNVPLWRERAAAGFAQLAAHPRVDRDRIAAIGYCFGGRGALELAQVEPTLVGAVAFHPTLAPMPDAGRVNARVLVLGGDADPAISDKAIVEFKSSLRGTDVDWQLVTYSNAMHGFTIVGADAPERGVRYQAAADRRSWTAMLDFFTEIFA